MDDILWAVLLLGIAVFAFLIGKRLGIFFELRRFEKDLPKIRKEAIEKSRSVLTGKFSEQVSPYFPGFPYNPSEARFIGSPIDFLIFEGMDEKDIRKVVFVEVKSGNSRLSRQERNLKAAIEDGNVEWYEFRASGPE